MGPGMRVSEARSDDVYEVSLFWGERLLDVRMASAKRAPRWRDLPAEATALFTEGDREAARQPLWLDAGGELRLTHPSANRTHRLSGKDAVTLRSGNLSLAVRPGARPPPIAGASLKDRDFSFFKLAAVTGMAAVALVLALVLPPVLERDVDALFRAPRPTVSDLRPPMVVKPTFTDPKTAQTPEDTADASSAPTQRPTAREPARSGGGGGSKLKARDTGLLAMGGGSLSTLLSGGGFERAVQALDGLTGSGGPVTEVGISGIGTRGPGPGGGAGGPGVGMNIGDVGTRFGGRGPGSGIGPGLGPKKQVSVAAPPKIVGGLDRADISRVIRQHEAAIRACYESGLSRDPELAGKVAVSFVIDATGNVVRADVADSSMQNAVVESCMLQRIGTWRFPEPRGGGQVTVHFPWLFRPAGTGE